MDETVQPADTAQTEATPVADAAPVTATYTDSNGDTHDAEVLAQGNGYATINIRWSDGAYSQAANVPLNSDGKPNTYKTNEA